MDFLALIDKVDPKIIAGVLILNVALSAASKILEVLGKKIPLLEKIAEYGQKLVDLISANRKH